MRILLTGCAGFIGYHAAQCLLAAGHSIIGVDSVNDYYDPALKAARLEGLERSPNFSFQRVDLTDYDALQGACKGQNITHILHLAAQAGVRYSLENPRSYIASNITAHLNILELARHMTGLQHLVYASSSSVYGERDGGNFGENDLVRAPASLYAATKISGEMLAESYARLYDIPQTGLRFFTVYGAFGRPDMAYYIFIEKLLKGEPITLFAPDEMQRDFTYIDDITAVLPRLLSQPPQPKDGRRHEIYNLGNSAPMRLYDLVAAIETACGIKAKIDIAPKQPGDVSRTFANIDKARQDLGFNPQTSLSAGIKACVEWHRNYLNLPLS